MSFFAPRCRALATWCLPLVLIAPTAWAAPVAFPTNTTAVTLDGAPLGTGTLGSGLRNTVVQAADGSYHLWAIMNNPDSVISRIVHATATDGIHFITQGRLAPPANYWSTYACGLPPATEPIASFLRVSQVGGEWMLAVWHQNQPPHTYYSYNTSVWRLGADPANLAPTLVGPLPSTSCATAAAPGRFHLGVFGMADSRIWLRQASGAGSLPGALGGNLGGYTIDLNTAPPTTSPRPSADASVPKLTREADLFAGTGFYETGTAPAGATRAYVYNAGRTLAQGGAIGTYYSFINFSTDTAIEKELRYVESSDGGITWTVPARIYGGQGAQVLVNGLPNGGNFNAPEVTTGGRAYFTTRDACNNAVMVTAADAAADPRLAVTKRFSPASVAVGGTSQLSITVQAPAGCTPAPVAPVVTSLALADALQTGLLLTGNVVSNTCGGTLSAPAGTTSLTLGGVALNMGQSCTAVVEVQANAAGTYDNVIAASSVTNDQALLPAQDAAARLVVAGPVQPVPAHTPWGLAALAGLMGLVVAWRRQRRPG